MPPPSPVPNQQPNAFFNTVLNNTTSSPSSPRSRPGWPTEAPPFTATQRSAQARNKDFSNPGKEDRKSSRKSGQIPESYEQRQLRNEAACILESSEMLMWHSAMRNEVRSTISQLDERRLIVYSEYSANTSALSKHRPGSIE